MKSNFFAILSILFVHVLVVRSWRIETTAGEQLAENGAFYNPNRFGGPISAKIYEIHPQLAFLGNYNQKFWYIERSPLNYAQAKGNCTQMGMSIARTEQADLNFLFTVTESTDTPWVGAVLPVELSSFVWEGTDDEHPSTLFSAATNQALRIVRAANGLSSLTPAAVTGTRFALCSIP